MYVVRQIKVRNFNAQLIKINKAHYYKNKNKKNEIIQAAYLSNCATRCLCNCLSLLYFYHIFLTIEKIKLLNDFLPVVIFSLSYIHLFIYLFIFLSSF